MLKKILKKFFSSEFNKNALILVSGTILAQSIPVLISPVLTRLYTPASFGVLQVFTSLSMIFGVIGNARYEMAILLPKQDSRAVNIWFLTIVVALTISSITFLSVCFFHDFWIEKLKTPQLSFWIYLFPLTALFIAVYNSSNYFLVREKNFKKISAGKVVRSGTVSLLQLSLFQFGSAGLITGFLLGQISGAFFYVREIIKKSGLVKKIKKVWVIALAKRYKKFPLLTAPASLFNRTATELPNILISGMFSATTLGFYSLAFRILSVPSSFIGMSIGQIYMKEATDEKHRTGKATKIFWSVTKKLAVIGLLFYGFLYFTAEPIFAFVFGNEWIMAGTYAKIISPLLFVKFIVSPLSVSFSVFEKQNRSFLMQAGLLLTVIAVFTAGYFFKMPFERLLQTFVFALVGYYGLFFLLLHKTVKNK